MGWLQSWNFELSIVVKWSCIAATLPIANKWVVSVLWGEDPDMVWKTDPSVAEAQVMISLDAIVTCLCLFIPVRSCILWIVPMSAWVSFSSMLFVAGSPYPGIELWFSASLAALFFLAIVGAREHEVNVRLKWSAQQQLQESQEEIMDRDIMIEETSAQLQEVQEVVLEQQVQ